ncbi:type II secretion system protein [Campylobacter devanensis]|uniref:type II secretion system protein n=1 Tax=Campylobacter devanensis TaxID=3161138 RepID=UPI001F23ACE4|nr:type II secretion system protein [Campylobacter sp. P0088]
MIKGFTMIELIFVIVILGILASVAIPRLAATRTDAEISATIANIRILLSDLNSYYAVKDEFPQGSNGVKWSEITNVHLENANSSVVGGERCIEVSVSNRVGVLPAYITFTKYPTNQNKGVCKEALEADAVKAFINSKILDTLPGKMAIGSSTTIY